VSWCHSDRDDHPSGLPKAKRSAGHYTIDSLIQKVQAVSLCVFEPDYLCLRPRAAGIWFSMFDETGHVSEAAEFDAAWPAHLAIDPGVPTGAIWFQVVQRVDGRGHRIIVFADCFAEGFSAETNARAIVERSRQLCGIEMDRLRVSMDPAGEARRAVGPTVRGECGRAGFRGRNGLESWPTLPKADGLQLVEALLKSRRRLDQSDHPSEVPAADHGAAMLRPGASGRSVDGLPRRPPTPSRGPGRPALRRVEARFPSEPCPGAAGPSGLGPMGPVTPRRGIAARRRGETMRLRYAWTDLPFFILGVVLLIPLIVHLAEIVIDLIASTEF
jgi:hypothetical protein